MADHGTDAEIIVLRNEQTGNFEAAPANGDAKTRARQGAQERKAIFEHRLAGSTARAGKLPRSLTASLAAGTANLMLMRILQDELVPGSAKEAADVAKIAHEIYKSASGSVDGKHLTPDERAKRFETAEQLAKDLAERAKKVGAPLAGAPNEGEELTGPEWEHEAEIPPPSTV